MSVKVYKERTFVKGMSEGAAGWVGYGLFAGIIDSNRLKARWFDIARYERVARLGKEVFGMIVGDK